MEVIRLISIFDKKTEELIEEVNIDYIELDILKKIFNPKENDPLMYNPYTIKKDQVNKLREYINLDFYFDKHIYQVDCFQRHSNYGDLT